MTERACNLCEGQKQVTEFLFDAHEIEVMGKAIPNGDATKLSRKIDCPACYGTGKIINNSWKEETNG